MPGLDILRPLSFSPELRGAWGPGETACAAPPPFERIRRGQVSTETLETRGGDAGRTCETLSAVL